MIDLVCTAFGLASTIAGLFYLICVIMNWVAEQEHRRCLEARDSLKKYLRQDKEDGDDQARTI